MYWVNCNGASNLVGLSNYPMIFFGDKLIKLHFQRWGAKWNKKQIEGYVGKMGKRNNQALSWTIKNPAWNDKLNKVAEAKAMASLSISTVIFPSKSNLTKSSQSSTFHGVQVAHFSPTRFPSVWLNRASSPSSNSVVMMAKREDELKDIRTKSTEELNEEIVDLKGELFMLRLQRSARKEIKSSEFWRMRKRVLSFSSFCSSFFSNVWFHLNV